MVRGMVYGVWGFRGFMGYGVFGNLVARVAVLTGPRLMFV